MNLQELLLFEEALGGRMPPLIARPPLIFPSAPHPYRTELPWEPPLSRDYLRGDMWGVTIEGAPFVPGGSSKYPQRILSWFLDRYPVDFQMRYLELVASYGYTHVYLSAWDSMGPYDNGPLSPPGWEQTLPQFVQTCKRVQSVRSARDGKPLSVHVMLGSKYFNPRDMLLPQYQSIFTPILDALLSARACDEVSPGWEWNLWNIPGDPTLDIFKWVGRYCNPHGVTNWWHGSPHYIWWGAEGTDRFQFWDALGPDCQGVDYQCDPTWCIDEVQARMVDTLWQFGQQGNVHKLRLFEDLAVLEFDGHPAPCTGIPTDEAQCTARGYLGCCTVDNVRGTDAKTWGYGNGGSMPDGWVL